jgi:hypothetical protein
LLGTPQTRRFLRHPAAQDQDVCFLIERCDEQHQEKEDSQGLKPGSFGNLSARLQVVP